MRQLKTKWADNINVKECIRGISKTIDAPEKLCESERCVEICNKRTQKDFQRK